MITKVLAHLLTICEVSQLAYEIAMRLTDAFAYQLDMLVQPSENDAANLTGNDGKSRAVRFLKSVVGAGTEIAKGVWSGEVSSGESLVVKAIDVIINEKQKVRE